MSNYMVRTVLPYLTQELGGSELWVARVLYLSFVVLALLSPFMGWLCDRYGLRRVLVTTALFLSLTTTLYLAVSSLTALVVVRVLHAVATELLIASSLALASHVTSHYGLGIGVLRAAQGLGIGLGPLLAGALSVVLGLDPVLLVAAVLALAPLTCLTLSPEVVQVRRAHLFTKALRTVLRYFSPTWLTPVLTTAVAQAVSFTILTTYYTAYLTVELGLSPWEYGLFLVAECLGFSLGSLVSEYLYEKYRYSTLTVSTILLGVLYYLLSQVTAVLSIIVLVTPLGFLSALIFNPLYVECARRLPEEVRGTGVNLVDTIVNLSCGSVALLEPLMQVLTYRYSVLVPVAVLLTAALTSATYVVRVGVHREA